MSADTTMENYAVGYFIIGDRDTPRKTVTKARSESDALRRVQFLNGDAVMYAVTIRITRLVD